MQLVKYINSLDDSINFSIKSNFILQRIEGTGNVEANHRTSNIPLQHGSQRTKTSLNNRYIKLLGTIKGNSRKQLAELKEVLCDIFNPNLDDGRLEYNAGNGTKFIYAIPEETPIFSEYTGDTVSFVIELVCHDPYWHDLEWCEYVFSTPYTSLFRFPQSFQNQSFQMGYQTEKRTFHNAGNEETPLILEFEGGIKNVKFTNLTNGEWVEFKKKLNSNEMLYINSSTGQKEIKIIDNQGNERNGYGLLTFDCSSFMHLVKGENVIEFVAEPDLSLGKVKMKWLTNYLGV